MGGKKGKGLSRHCIIPLLPYSVDVCRFLQIFFSLSHYLYVLSTDSLQTATDAIRNYNET